MTTRSTTDGIILPNYNIVGDNKEKRIFKIEVGNIADEDVEAYVRKIQEQIKRNPYDK